MFTTCHDYEGEKSRGQLTVVVIPKHFLEKKGKSDFNSQITSSSINILAKQRLYMREYTLHFDIHTVTQLQILSCHQDLNDMRWEGGLHPAHRLASSEVIKEKKHFTGKR